MALDAFTRHSGIHRVTYTDMPSQVMTTEGGSAQVVNRVTIFPLNVVGLRSGTGADTVLNTVATSSQAAEFPDTSGTVSLV